MSQNIAKSHIRQPAVASLFYPEGVSELQTEVRHLLNSVKNENVKTQELIDSGSLKALIVPHAGYIFSGNTAAKAYHLLTQIKKEIKRVAILGPSHLEMINGIGVPSSIAFKTPLGCIPIAQKQIMELLEKFQFVEMRDDAHKKEYCLEVQLPFLQEVLTEFELLPMLVGNTQLRQLAELFETILDPESLILVSTDLSHFHQYDIAVELDEKTAKAIESFDEGAISPEQACGAHSLRGLLRCAKESEWKITRLGLCNSADNTGSKDRVVGYGAWALTETRR